MISLDDILNDVKAYNPGAQTDLIRLAYDFSAKAHEGQKRKSGEPYLVHPLEVAKILTQLKMDADSIVAAILHDTIEDTKTTKKDIEKAFGKEIAENISILYGGSCNPKNAASIFSQSDVDGGLIGGASLQTKDFMDVIKACAFWKCSNLSPWVVSY